MKHPVFVPNGDSRRQTAILLTGTAAEFGVSQKSIKATTAGFFITEELADLVYEDSPAPTPAESAEATSPVPEPGPEPAPDYAAWEYSALKHEVAERGLDVPDQKKDTLIAALAASGE